MKFEDLNLDPRIMQAIQEAGFSQPTPIQSMAIPEIMAGKDLRASAQTGTGKTAAFLLPALQRLATPCEKKGIGPRILVLVPTRELAMQVAKESEKHSKFFSRVKTVCLYGGVPYPVQNRQLSRPYEILVVTPGRLLDHLQRGRVDLSRVEMLVLDEADRMLDMGFISDVEEIVSHTPATRQTLLFSATFKEGVKKLAQKLMKDPVEVSVIPNEENYAQIDQSIYFTDGLNHKVELLKHFLTDASINQCIVFTMTKRYAEELSQELREIGHLVSPLHGDMDQRKRTRVIENMRQGRVRIIVATDVAARGIDIPAISHVYNFDLPRCAEDYTHRIGRTGRAGASGVAISFASPQERTTLKEIEKFIKRSLSIKTVPGMEPRILEEKKVKKPFKGPRRGHNRTRAKNSCFIRGK